MIVAGRIASKFCSDNELYVPYRGQPSIFDSTKQIETLTGTQAKANTNTSLTTDLETLVNEVRLKGNESGLIPYFQVKKILPSFSSAAAFDRPVSHYAMGLPGLSPVSSSQNTRSKDSEILGYVKATSPLRRFSDMIVHWQIRSKILNGKQEFTKDDISKILTRLKDVESKAKKLSKSYDRSWVLEWCRRRELNSRILGGDDMQVRDDQQKHLGVGMSYIEKGNIPTKIARTGSANLYIQGLPKHTPMYTAIIRTVPTESKLNGFNDRVFLPSAFILELGGQGADIMIPPERLRDLKEGDTLNCVVWRVDPNYGQLVMAAV
jgi:hypothetical protein